MKIFWLYHLKNVLEISVLHWESKSCNVIYSFILKNGSVEKTSIYNNSFFFFLKKSGLKRKTSLTLVGANKIDNGANKIKIINILDFGLIWISL